MRTETREVVEIREVYIADDGTEFVDEYECLGYEKECVEKKLKFFGAGFEKCGFDNCYYVKLDTEADVTELIDLCNYEGVTSKGLDKPGVYMFDGGYHRSEAWINISHILKSIIDTEVCGDA